jgi:transcriptional regulator with XRE-family HTH domain
MLPLVSNVIYGAAMNRVEIGKRLLELRKSTGLNQAEFGKTLGLSDRAYKNYELGIRDLPSETAIKICIDHNVSGDWLLLGRGARSAESFQERLNYSISVVDNFLEDNQLAPTTAGRAELIEYVFQRASGPEPVDKTILSDALKGVFHDKKTSSD